jgi:Ala-tRNA(Pro) deacylase
MHESVFLRLENLLKQHGVNFEVLRHQPVFTSEEAAAIRGVALSTGAKALICKVDACTWRIAIQAAIGSSNNS